jgi:hypothetical protein
LLAIHMTDLECDAHGLDNKLPREPAKIRGSRRCGPDEIIPNLQREIGSCFV